MIEDITLSRGAHNDRDNGLCLLEAVAWLAGEEHTDRPVCVSGVLAAYGRELNDVLLPARVDLEPRIRALAPMLVGTAGRPELDHRASLLALDWLVRIYTPAWLRLAKINGHADNLENCEEVTSWDDVPTDALAAARAAAGDARDASRAAARAAQNATRAAAWAAAQNATRAAAGDAALDAALDAAWAAALDAAQNATRVADRAAAWGVVSDALAPTVRDLQDSALDLYERMIALWEMPNDGAVASDSDWNHRLLGDLFDHVYRTMKTARGQRETVSSDRYLDGEAILTVVKQAIRKAEMDALDTWRKAAP
jgi:hypothetical protein